MIAFIKKRSSHRHFVKSIFDFGKGSYPSDYYIYKYSSERAIAELKLENRPYEDLRKTLRKVISFLDAADIQYKDSKYAEKLKENIWQSSEEFGGFDIIHSHFILPANLAQNQGFSTLCTSHSLLSKEISYGSYSLPLNKKTEFFDCLESERTIYRDTKNLIVLSEDHKNEIKELSGRDAKLMNPIFDIAEFENPEIKSLNTSQARISLELPDITTILYIGRPAFRKGIECLLEAFSGLNDQNIQLLIIGKGFELNKDENYIRYGNRKIELEEKVMQKILFPIETNSRTHIILGYKASDIVVCPSLYEPFGYVNIEALAAKRPVVASKIGGISEIIKDGESGILFIPGDAKDLQEKLLILLRDPSLREKMGKTGYRQIKKRFNVTDQIAEIDKLYESLAE